MKRYIMYLGLLLMSLAISCSKDLGNYDYKEINELTITGIAGEYRSIANVDTLKITPEVSRSLDGEDADRYLYRWIARKNLSFEDTIGRTLALAYPVKLPPDNYVLLLKVTDTKTNIVWETTAKYTVGTLLSRGIMLMGENEEGRAEVDMITMSSDTTVVRGLLASSGLPALYGPIGVQHSGGMFPQQSKLWVFTQTGSYFMDRASFTGTVDNNFAKLTYTSLPISHEGMRPVLLAPQITSINGTLAEGLGARMMITKDGNIYGGNVLENGGDYYANPVNRLESDPQTLLPAAPYLLYPLKNATSMVWYDQTHERFMCIPSFYGNFTSITMADGANDSFSWNQAATGRTLVYAENTTNSDGGAANGNSFAVMKNDADEHFIYKFYVNGNSPQKTGYYTVKPLAINFERATQYAFSSYRTIVFYIADGRLYAYDYNPGNERLYQFTVAGGDQVTMVKFDTQIYPLTNSLYIATYNPATKGALQRYTVGTNPNVVEIQPVESEKWDNLIKIKNWSWRAVN